VSFAPDRYGHLFPGSGQKLNDALDARAIAEARSASVEAVDDVAEAVTAKHPSSNAHVTRTPADSDSDSTAEGA
jgi:hypothetical protein